MRNYLRNKDRIFWIASAIFVISLIVMSITQEQLWGFLMVASYLLRPTLASLGVARQSVDERQMSLHYRSGNIAFAVMIMILIAFAVELSIKGDHTWEEFAAVVYVGLAVKATVNVVLSRNFRVASRIMILAVGLLMALFVLMENGLRLQLFPEILPALAIIVMGILAKKYPRVVGAIVLAMTVVAVFFILRIGFYWGQFITAAMIGVPMMLAGWGLIKPDVETLDGEEMQTVAAK